MAEPTDPRDINRQAQEIWDRNAPFWDSYMGEGRAFQKVLIGPATERLLGLQAGEEVLEVACGNGGFARRMAQLGARVVASDFSSQFLQLARQRTTQNAERIEYRLIDATDQEQVLALGRRRFDAAVCIMGLMDMAVVEPLLAGLAGVLKPGGRFVFSVMHPCFNNTAGCSMVAEQEDREGELITVYFVKVTKYVRPSIAKGLGIVGQPVPQYYFHRPLSVLFGACFEAGFLLDGLEEPTFGEEGDPQRPFSWAHYREIPPVLVARMRLRKE